MYTVRRVNYHDISRKQINAFAKLYSHDVRAAQPRNGRVVKETR